MAHLIDKDALVAEIERRIKRFREEKDSVSIVKTNTYKGILSFIDSLEEKEVDLEKEVNDYGYHYDYVSLADRKELVDFAKHFFELGLNTQHSSINIPNIDDILEESGIDPYSKEAKIFKESYYMVLEKLKAQKGE